MLRPLTNSPWLRTEPGLGPAQPVAGTSAASLSAAAAAAAAAVGEGPPAAAAAAAEAGGTAAQPVGTEESYKENNINTSPLSDNLTTRRAVEK